MSAAEQIRDAFNRAAEDGGKVIAIAAVLPLLEQLLFEHDRRGMVADELAAGIARLTGVELSVEDPWGTALAASYVDTWNQNPAGV